MRYFRGVVESPYAPPTDMLWIYQNELKYFSNGKWEIINNPKITETIPVSVIKENIILPYITLEVGKSKKIKTENYNKLINDTSPYYLNINGGLGVYSWNSKEGGQAHIINFYGDTTYYSISSDGSLEKSFESPDIYLDYINAGGKKNKEEFIKDLVDLIG